MQEIDKEAMGRRIREIRSGAGLRQWELARMLGTTQSAIHKYEHGVVPEPRRLVELARIGETSVEWVLTGEHWENGSGERLRIAPEVLDLAARLTEMRDGERKRVREAIEIVRTAIAALDDPKEAAVTQLSPHAASLRAQAAETLSLLERAWSIQRDVLGGIARATSKRLAGGS